MSKAVNMWLLREAINIIPFILDPKNQVIYIWEGGLC